MVRLAKFSLFCFGALSAPALAQTKSVHLFSPWQADAQRSTQTIHLQGMNGPWSNWWPGEPMTSEGGGWYSFTYPSLGTDYQARFTVAPSTGLQQDYGELGLGNSTVIRLNTALGTCDDVYLIPDPLPSGPPIVTCTPPSAKYIMVLNPFPLPPVIRVEGKGDRTPIVVEQPCGWFAMPIIGSDPVSILLASGTTTYGATGLGSSEYINLTDSLAIMDTVWVSSATPQPTISRRWEGATGRCAVIRLASIIRDFPITHPDFEPLGEGWSGKCNGGDDMEPELGMVQPLLGPDRKPVKARDACYNSRFDEWFGRSPGPYATTCRDLDLTLNPAGQYEKATTAFFPVDDLPNDALINNNSMNRDLSSGDSTILAHNYHFCMETRASFTYKGGEVFTFRGDDDVWVFINGQLVSDIGGIHQQVERTIYLDGLGLSVGQVYPFDFFYCERQSLDANMRITTSIDLVEAREVVLDMMDLGGGARRYVVYLATQGGVGCQSSSQVRPLTAQFELTGPTIAGRELLTAGIHYGGIEINNGRDTVRVDTTRMNNLQPGGTYILYVLDPDAVNVFDSIIIRVPGDLPPPNTPPTISAITNRTIVEDGTTGNIAFTIGDAETPLDQLQIFVNSSDPVLTPTTSLVVAGTGANRTLNISPPPNLFGGPATITITVRDGGGLIATSVFTLTVTPVNDKPTLQNAEFTIQEEPEIGTILGFMQVSDVEDVSFIFDWVGPTPVSRDAISISSTGRILITNGALLDYETRPVFVYTVIVTDRDPVNPLSDTATLTINLLDVNDPPVLSLTLQSIPENSGEGTVVGTLSAIDPNGDPITYSISGGVDALSFIMHPTTGVLTVAPGAVLDYETRDRYFVILRASDGEFFRDTSVVVLITDVNEPPTIAAQSFTVQENTAVGTRVGALVASDPDGDVLQWTLLDPSPFRVDSAGGLYVVESPDYEEQTSYSVRVRISDGEFSDTATITISIGNVVEATDVRITSIIAGDSTWPRRDTVRTNAEEVTITARIEGSRDTSITTAVGPGVNRTGLRVCEPDKDICGSDSVVVLVNREAPQLTFEHPIPDTSGLRRLVYTYIPSDTVFVNDPNRTFQVMIVQVGADLRPDTLYREVGGNLVEGFQELEFTWVDPFGNTVTGSLPVVLDTEKPVVRIISPTDQLVVEVYNIDVDWTVDGEAMDTLLRESLNLGANSVVRRYMDRAGNLGSDSVRVALDIKRPDVIIDLERPLTVLRPSEVTEVRGRNPLRDNESFSLIAVNQVSNRETELAYGNGNSQQSGDRLYADGESLHLGPTLRIEIKFPHVGGFKGDGTFRGGTLAELMENEAATDSGVDVLCGESMPADPTSAPLWNNRLSVVVSIFDNMGQYVDRFKVDVDSLTSEFLNDGGVAVFYLVLEPDEELGLRTTGGRAFGNGAYILRGEARGSSTFLYCSTDRNKGEVIRTTESILKTFGYRRLDPRQ